MELNNQISDDIMLKNISKMLPGSGSSLSFLGIRYWFYCFFSACHIDPRELDVVTITLRSDPRSFTDSELTTIREQIALLLHQQGSVNININIDDVMVEPKSGIGLSLFYLLVQEFIFGFCLLQAILARFCNFLPPSNRKMVGGLCQEQKWLLY